MTKRDIVKSIAKETGLAQRTVFGVVEKTLNHVTRSLEHGETVELRNFGVFKVVTRQAKVGRNPKKPEQIFQIPAHKTVKFKPGKIMKEVFSKTR